VEEWESGRRRKEGEKGEVTMGKWKERRALYGKIVTRLLFLLCFSFACSLIILVSPLESF
jgi:hypothetical protein